MKNESIEDLKGFFEKTQEVFEEILEDDDWFLDNRLQISAKSAWEELKPKFDELKEEIAAITTSKTGNDERLVRSGLSGEQLSFKLTAFDLFCKKNLIKKILGAINSILSSLILGFPLAEPIKEFKDFLELSGKDF